MSVKSVREGDAKSLLNRFVQHQFLKKLNKHIFDPRYTNELKGTFNIESIKISTEDKGGELFVLFVCLPILYTGERL